MSTLVVANHRVETAPARLGYILSASHSGSTLLAMLLGAQLDACSVGELRAPAMGDTDVYRCSCGQRIKECQFWTNVSLGMAEKGIVGFDITNAGTSIFEGESRYVRRLLDPLQRGMIFEGFRELALRLSPSWPVHLRTIQTRNAALVAVLQELTGAKLVIDSSKAVLQLSYLLKGRGLEIKVIRLIRDGRAVALSLIGHGMKRATRQETIATAAREWLRSNEAAECLLRRLPSTQWMEVKYETLCARPKATLERLCAFLGLDTAAVTSDFRAKPQHIIGNSMRLNSTAEIRLDERWRTELSQDDLRAFDTVAGDLNRKYGYR